MKFSVEEIRPGSSFVIGPDGTRWFMTTRVRARAIAAALNTPAAQEAFLEERAKALLPTVNVELPGV